MSTYYDGTKLLSLKDINGKDPEIYIVTGNRSSGKTTFYSRYFVKRFINNGEKFAILYRFNYELKDCAEKFFADIGKLFFPEYEMTSIKGANGIYYTLLLNDEVCGYAITLNNADNIRKMSHMLSDVKRILFDEFQSETNHYCNDEIVKFMSIHTSLARGNGSQVRYLPVFMLSNNVSIINPYFTELGISSRLKVDTKFLKGDGFVLEQNYNDNVSEMQLSSAFNRAFSENEYVAYASQNVYLNDNTAFIERPVGRNKYVVTLKYKGKNYGVREFLDLGIVYCDDHPDLTYPNRISVTTQDHQINYVMLKNNDLFLYNMRFYFERGCFRFKDLHCKEAILTALSY